MPQEPMTRNDHDSVVVRVAITPIQSPTLARWTSNESRLDKIQRRRRIQISESDKHRQYLTKGHGQAH